MDGQLSLPIETCWCCEKPGQLTPDPDGLCVNGPECTGEGCTALICEECAALIAAETPEDKELPE